MKQAEYAASVAFWLEDTGDLDVLDALATVGLKLVPDTDLEVCEAYRTVMTQRLREGLDADESGVGGAGPEAGEESEQAREEGGGLRLV